MLHKVKMPQSYAALEQIVDFQGKVLRFTCNVTLPLSQDKVQIALGQIVGTWFWERLYFHGKRTKFGEYWEDLVKYVNNDKMIAQRIILAFEHDVTFHDYLEDETFQFQYNHLTSSDHEVIKPFMVAFYEKLLTETGFPPDIHHTSGFAQFKREDWNSDFWTSNHDLGVCPACDGQYPPMMENGKVRSEVDHFLPKSLYPFLSVHPDNLIPICGDCNSIKLNEDPIDDHSDAPLLNTFHPYHRPAFDYIRINLNRNDRGVISVVINEQDSTKSRRTKRFSEILGLEKRWGGTISIFIRSVLASFRDNQRSTQHPLHYRHSRSSSKKPVDKPGLVERLESILEQKQERLDTNNFVHAQYLDYLLCNQDEIDYLFGKITNLM